jgi:hypothetical protein
VRLTHTTQPDSNIHILLIWLTVAPPSCQNTWCPSAQEHAFVHRVQCKSWPRTGRSRSHSSRSWQAPGRCRCSLVQSWAAAQRLQTASLPACEASTARCTGPIGSIVMEIFSSWTQQVMQRARPWCRHSAAGSGTSRYLWRRQCCRALQCYLLLSRADGLVFSRLSG